MRLPLLHNVREKLGGTRRWNWSWNCSPYIYYNVRCGRMSSSSAVEVPPPEIARAYDPSEVERRILEKWEGRKVRWDKDAPTFRMILPPPNVTGKLHLGHALTLAVEDVIARWKVMNGYNVEWIPGFDHAGIATQSVVTRQVQKLLQSDSKEAVDMDKQLRSFSDKNLASIRGQLKSMGTLLDWESTYYTLDENHSAVVKEAFVQLYESGLISRADGIVNWCCALESSVADVEVDDVDFKGRLTMRVPGYEMPVEFGLLYFCGYKFEDSDEHLVVATSRPETMFGDVALAVNPNDSRYAQYIGRKVINPVNKKRIPVIGDNRVKTDFGSGVLKITPAHDKQDFAIGQSHNLDKVTVFAANGCLNDRAGPLYEGLSRFTARKIVLDQLEQEGALFGSKEYSGSFGLCSRTGDVIEPRVLPHWFLHTQNLTEKFLESINNGQFIISPDNHRKDLVSRLQECQDWCLSRQIQWGHPIPAYYHKDFPAEWVSATDLETAKKKLQDRLGIQLKSDSDVCQDSDVLDTWFSSALIPLSTSGWPDADLKPISLMETGHDILLFWVWRMAIVTSALVNQLPFNNILLHGIVTDHYGRKMSKSRGNVINPMHVINGISYKSLLEEAQQALSSGELQKNEYELRFAALRKDYPEGFKTCGTDALRFALLSQDIMGVDLKLETTYLENCRHFNNKIWQALRFFMIHVNANPESAADFQTEILKPNLNELKSIADHWLLACLYDFTEAADTYLDKAQFHLYAECVRKFFYQQLCDTFIELIKSDLKAGLNYEQHLSVMRYAIATGLKIAHPLLPFVTEEMWPHITNNEKDLIIDQKFPKPTELAEFANPQVDQTISKVMKVVKEIRSVKVRAGMKLKSVTQVYLDIPSTGNIDVVKMVNLIENLSFSQVEFGNPPALVKSNYFVVIFPMNEDTCKISVLKGEKTAADIAQEKEKISKLQKKFAKLKEQFESPKFQKAASPAVKEKFRKKLEVLELQLNEISQSSADDGTSQSPFQS